MSDFTGWQVVGAHLTSQQRLQIRNEHVAQNGSGETDHHTLENGWSIKKLNQQSDYDLEGQLMDNCVGGYGPDRGYHDVYSLRDPDNLPYITFRMRHRTADDHAGYWGTTTNQEEADTGNEVLATTSVLGRNNERPKEDYGKHLISALSSYARSKGIDKVSWDQGPLKTPDQMDQFIERENTSDLPSHVYIQTPMGSKDSEGNVRFYGEEEKDGRTFNRNYFEHMTVSQDEPAPKPGFHTIKTPFSEKRFERVDDLGTRLNSPESVTGGWKIKMAPNSNRPGAEGLKKTQVEMVSEAEHPEHLYMKMKRGTYNDAQNQCKDCKGQGSTGRWSDEKGCGTCGGTPDVDPDEPGGRKGTGKGDWFQLTQDHYSSRNQELSTDDFTDENGKYTDYDHHVVKVKFNEDNFDFNPTTGKYSAKSDTHVPMADVEKAHNAYTPETLYMAIDSAHRGNKWVYGPDGIEPTFIRNKEVSISPDRTHFVGAKKNDIIAIDTSKLPEGALSGHRHGTQGTGRGRGWRHPDTDLWKLNDRVPIPYDAVVRNNSGTTEPGTQLEFNVFNPSEVNKRKKHFTPQIDEEGRATVLHAPEDPPEAIHFGTSIKGRTIKAIRSLEAGNVPADVGIGTTNARDGEIRAKFTHDPELHEEITPTHEQIRNGSSRYGGGREVNVGGASLVFDHDRFPSERFFRLKQEVASGHPSLISMEGDYSTQAAKGDRDSIVPDVAFLHVPRRNRGDEDLYTDEGIQVDHITKGNTSRDASTMKHLHDKPIEGGPGDVDFSENPQEMDVWAIDMKHPALEGARYQGTSSPYSYRSEGRKTHATFAMPFKERDKAKREADDGDKSKQVVPWDAVMHIHRKPEEPTAPAIRKYFNTASVSGWKALYLTNVK